MSLERFTIAFEAVSAEDGWKCQPSRRVDRMRLITQWLGAPEKGMTPMIERVCKKLGIEPTKDAVEKFIGNVVWEE